jgi:hypothetical protein
MGWRDARCPDIRIAVIAGPVIVVVGQLLEFGSLDVPGMVPAIVFATAAAAVILFPLLLVCLLCGQVWASITSRVAARPASQRSVAPIQDGPLTAGIVVFLGLAWVPAVWILGLLAADATVFD